ncbi:MAG: hypothetical protein IKV21_05930 [Clostridia bacterium]|nr:hypothetical protein [Clostridia bacterium]
MENKKTSVLLKFTALMMACLMVFSASFTPAMAIEDELEYVAVIGETGYESLQQAADAAEDGAVITLLDDAEGNGIFVGQNRNITFDFAGHTYTVIDNLVGSSGTKSQAMHLEKGSKITLKNGTLKAGGDVRMLVQNYSDLTLEDFNLDTNQKKIYALSNNCGNILITGESNITSDAAALDLWYNHGNGYPEGVSVTFDENYTGTVIGNIEYGAENPAEGWTEKTALTIKGGTFEGELVNTSDFDIATANITVYGGTFADEKMKVYLDECYTTADGDNKFEVIPFITSGGKAYKSLQDAVDAAQGETVITLNVDMSGSGVKVSADKDITFDFAGHTYTVDGSQVGSEGTENNGMQLLKGAKVTLKNGTLAAGKKTGILVQNYSDLTLNDFNLDATTSEEEDVYALSNNCGEVVVTGNGNISSNYTAFDLWYNLCGWYPEGVSVTFEDYTGTVSGNIEYGASVPTESWTEKAALVINGGTFEGKLVNASDFDFSAANITVYGGKFTDGSIKDFCAEDYKAVEDGDAYKVIEKDYIASLTGGKQFESLQEAVDAAEGAAVITLIKDATGNGIKVPAGKEITFKFSGHTYTVGGAQVGSAGTESNGMQLLKGATVTFENGTLVAGKRTGILVQNYADLTLNDFNLDATTSEEKDVYALSNNCGSVLVTGNGNISSNYTAFDLWYNLYGWYPEGVSVIFDDYTGTVKGNIEYGASVPTKNWTEKTALVIRGGIFEGEIINLAEEILYAGDMNITVSGGSFRYPLLKQWCAEGYEPALFDDGFYGACKHEFTQKTEDKDHFYADATCERGNLYYYDCRWCTEIGEKTFDDGKKKNHSFDEYISNNDGNCVKNATATAICQNCDATHTVVFDGTAEHLWGEWIVIKAASCTVNGEEERACMVCGKTEKRALKAKHSYGDSYVVDVKSTCVKKGSKSRHCVICDAKTDITELPLEAHSYSSSYTVDVAAACGKKGSKSRHCTVCDAKTSVTAIAALSHKYKVTSKKAATEKKDGSVKKTCSLCKKTTTEKIYKIKSASLSAKSYTYTGKAFKPTVTVKDSKGKKLKKDTDYTVKYSDNKNIGQAKVVITFKGNYSGKKTLNFDIVPEKVSKFTLTAKNDAMDVSWSTVKGAQGYEITYSTSKKFTAKTTKTTVTKSSKTKKTTLKKLKNATKYYVKIRAYKTVNGEKVYSAYSSVKNIKVK